jgi:hypothetical protein
MAGAEKLCASLRPVPANYAEARAERVLGVLANLFNARPRFRSVLNGLLTTPDVSGSPRIPIIL